MKTIKGDLLKLALAGEFDAIVHGCNCFNVMGAGIAGQIANHPVFNCAAYADKITERGSWLKLGQCSFSNAFILNGSRILFIINAYTQYSFGVGKQVEYCAVKGCMDWISNFLKRETLGKQTRIGLPQIGCGLGGGDWNIIKNIIEYGLRDFDVTIVEYDN